MTTLDWLYEPKPGEHLADMRRSGELAKVLPEVDALYGVPQAASHHPEICTGRHVELCLDAADMMEAPPAVRFAVLVHDLGKALTPAHVLPQHIDHEHRGVPLVQAVCDRLLVGRDMEELALLVCEHHLTCHRVLSVRSATVVGFLSKTGMEFRPGLLHAFVSACEADKRGRLGHLSRSYPQGLFLREVRQALEDLPMPPGTTPQSQGREAQERHGERLRAVRALMHRFLPTAGAVE